MRPVDPAPLPWACAIPLIERSAHAPAATRRAPGPEPDEADGRWGRCMAAAQAGDAASYRRLLHDIQPRLTTLILPHLDNPCALDAAICDVLHALHVVRHTYEPGRSFSAWLAGLVACQARLRPHWSGAGKGSSCA